MAKGWILWGWDAVCGFPAHLFNIEFRWYGHGVLWNVFGGLVALYFLYSLLRYFFYQAAAKSKDIYGDLFDKLNIGFFLIFLILIIFSIKSGCAPQQGIYVVDRTVRFLDPYLRHCIKFQTINYCSLRHLGHRFCWFIH
jgi:hypothetical protein